MLAFELPDLASESPIWIDVAATAAGATTGAIRGLRTEKFDIVGVIALAICIGFGGGMVRDILLGNTPPFALRTPIYLVTVLIMVAIVSFFGRYILKFNSIFVVTDSLTLGLFAIIGAGYALDKGLPWITAVLVGTFASVAGGMIADILQGQAVSILRAGPPYALASLAGALSYTVLVAAFGVDGGISSVVAIGLTAFVRFLAVKYGVRTKPATMHDVTRRWG